MNMSRAISLKDTGSSMSMLGRTRSRGVGGQCSTRNIAQTEVSLKKVTWRRSSICEHGRQKHHYKAVWGEKSTET
jgi:hypothetical protein